MVYIKTKNNITNLDKKNYNSTINNIWEITQKLVVLLVILLLGNNNFWYYLEGTNKLSNPLQYKIVFTVLVFIILSLYYIVNSNQDRRQIDILFTCIVLVYVLYIWINNTYINNESFMDIVSKKNGMYPIEKEIHSDLLVNGINKPEHYDYTPDDMPSYHLNDELKVFKQMNNMKKEDVNSIWMNKVKGYDYNQIPHMEGGFPFYNNKEKVQNLFDKKDHHKEWNDSILQAVLECPRTPAHLLDKSGDGLPDISHYHRKNGSGQSKYKFLTEEEQLESSTLPEVKSIQNEYKYGSDKVNFKIAQNNMNISQGCTNFPIPGYTNLKMVNDNKAYGINDN